MKILFKKVHYVALCISVALLCKAPVLAQSGPPQPDVSDLRESVVELPVTLKTLFGQEVNGKLVITHFRPRGDGPFPAVIFNHGRGPNRAQVARNRFPGAVRYFADRGMATFVLTRVGYGAMGIELDPEDSGGCRAKNYAPMMAAATHQTEVALNFAVQQAWVRHDRIVLAGQSVGGFTTVMASGKMLPGVVGAINFAGGAGGDPRERPEQPCEYFKIGDLMGSAGKTAKTPMLWLYSENDKYWGASIPRKWHEAYTSAGGSARLVMFEPVGSDGHNLLSQGARLWRPVVDEYLSALGL